jgi:hypothetical protein
MFSLQPPRYISTLPEITVPRRAIDGELAPFPEVLCNSVEWMPRRSPADQPARRRRRGRTEISLFDDATLRG